MMWIHEVDIWLVISSWAVGAASALAAVGVAWVIWIFKKRRR